MLAAAALFAWIRLMRVVRAFQRDAAAYWVQADALLESLRTQARQAERHVARTEALLGSAEGLEQTFEGATQFAVRTVTHPVVKAMAATTGMRQAWRRFRGREVATVPVDDVKPRMRVVSGDS